MRKLTDKQQEQVDRIQRLMEPWLRRLDLYNTWVLRVGVVSPGAMEKATGKVDAVCGVDVQLPYRKIHVVICGEYLAEASDVNLEQDLLHELVHVLLRPLVLVAEWDLRAASRRQFNYVHEEVTDAITNLLLWDSDGKRQRPVGGEA